ncbi:MAG TPA: sarcosine oxidase subunit gamma family protein [Aromatoleum sp.]|uniref:sarcosine oxidase subunit gamma n=1 Tax=Aromatoleum sp. TaxID=2307007 RepID=UPI002B491558|nr:sarcosine oxidase subunit gamma family protein [Aromatoleum sp.]HJV26824.1 sarcosine oxidase subunit gamma family protein [Aromatoleum sp.]
MSEFAQMDLNPRGAVKSESPLAMTRANVASANSARDAGVVVREKPFLGHLVLRGNAADEAFRGGVERVLGLALPLAMGPVSRDETRGVSIQWMSPDEWLIIVPAGVEFEAEAALRSELTGHYAVMNTTGGQTVLELSGPCVRELLMKCTPYDVHPRAFPVGKGITSVFAKSSAVIRHVEEGRWELVIRRSFADYLYRWILDAAEEFGVFVASAEAQSQGRTSARGVEVATS